MAEPAGTARDRRRGLGARRFTFAVVTDTHLNQGEDECNSPFAVNALANRRLRHVVNDLNWRDLAFVVNVGDLLHPVPAVPELYDRAAARYLEQSAALRHTQYLTPGNHDVGDKPNDWAPTATVCDAYLACWEEHFGPHYRSFDHGECHFVVINAQLLNSGLTAEAEQRDWLEADLAARRGRRIFLFTHYPPFVAEEDEPEHYDNIGEPGRSWLTGLVREYGVEALFAGHVHNFWFNRIGATDCYLLPSTAFVRQDYAEMYRAPPGPDDEAGRNDRPKLGYVLVHVHAGGHVCEPVRTYGATADAPVSPDSLPAPLAPPHPKTIDRSAFGFDMRQDWMETVEVPPSGGLDEFDRKRARNDYPLLGLWEMGIRTLRIPLSDLATPERRGRLRALAEHGFAYTLFSFGAPDTRTRRLVEDNGDLLSAWEAGFDSGAADRDLPEIAAAAATAGVPLYLSRLRSHDELRAEAGRYFHVVNHGFDIADRERIEALLRRPDLAGTPAGLAFRLPAGAPVCETLAAIDELAAGLGLRASVHLRTAGFDPSQPERDDLRIASRMAEALFTANTLGNVGVFADTLVDHDRGYFVRHGAYDRLCNPRPAARVLRHLNAVLAHYPECFGQPAAAETIAGGGRRLTSAGRRGSIELMLPEAVSEMAPARAFPAKEKTADATFIDLVSGLDRTDAAAGPVAAVRLQKPEPDC
ncbi:MAG: metallophosphoesterase [Rhodospirillaceae bacterium]|nr:metallophosphoesterase [Rhodospirillaceae bacterium]MCY4067009.1 metallophosphoesterase [Rhodospirillaceae bacterium]